MVAAVLRNGKEAGRQDHDVRVQVGSVQPLDGGPGGLTTSAIQAGDIGMHHQDVDVRFGMMVPAGARTEE